MDSTVNIHNHREDGNFRTDCIEILNCYPNKDLVFAEKGKYSVGIHPWFLDDAEKQLERFYKYIKNPRVVAVGEIGLDKNKPDFEKQVYYFKEQLKTAKEIDKPIIIHCVKAYQEVLQILNEEKITNTLIFHWFNGSFQLAEQLIKKGYYLSFGKSLFQETGKTLKAFKNIPLTNIFFETDGFNIEIDYVYKKAAEIRQINISELKKVILQSYYKVFSK